MVKNLVKFLVCGAVFLPFLAIGFLFFLVGLAENVWKILTTSWDEAFGE